MSEEALESQVEEAIEVQEEASFEDSEPKEYNIFTDDEVEPEAAAEPEPLESGETEVDKKRDSASWKVRKDREQRRKEIDLKRRHHEISRKEEELGQLSNSVSGFKDRFMDDPDKAFEDLGLDPMDVYQYWTRKMVLGEEEAPPEMRISSNEDRVKKLEAELERRDRDASSRAARAREDHAIGTYIGEIRSFMDNEDNFPLTKEQLSAEDIAQGIAAFHHNTGEQLSLREACEKIENGLREEEKSLFEDPAILKKFEKYHGLDASKRGRAASTTLSSKMNTRPTRTSGEELTLDEIKAKYANQLFT